MPRYYFHLFNDVTSLDEEGQELPSDDVALQKGAESARVMAAESVLHGHLVLDHRIVVCRADGVETGTIHFRDVVAIKG